MKALVFEKSGLENLKYSEYPDPSPGENDVMIRVKTAGVNPVDLYTVTSHKVNPIPHIPGVEFAGEVVKVGDKVKGVNVGDKVTIYGRVFDGTCDMCMEGYETVCRNGGRIGIDANGGWGEYVSLDQKYVYKVPEGYSWELSSSLTVAGLTAYHSLKVSGLRAGETLVVFGASGNTGMFLVQLGKKFGANVIAVSKKEWLTGYGADVVVDYDGVEDKVRDFTDGKMADVVVNSLGEKFWEKGLQVLGVRGRLITFGTLTGAEVKLNLSQLYSRHIAILGVNRGNRKDFVELINLCKDCKVKTWRKFKLKDGAKALKQLWADNRDGRILIENAE
ncbi:alcohol dehydrogenase [Sulfolobales archaeon HS-7]|nr:alcohol dehydrogenase [Sulfolobales archaeon HS-7]